MQLNILAIATCSLAAVADAAITSSDVVKALRFITNLSGSTNEFLVPMSPSNVPEIAPVRLPCLPPYILNQSPANSY